MIYNKLQTSSPVAMLRNSQAEASIISDSSDWLSWSIAIGDGVLVTYYRPGFSVKYSYTPELSQTLHKVSKYVSDFLHILNIFFINIPQHKKHSAKNAGTYRYTS